MQTKPCSHRTKGEEGLDEKAAMKNVQRRWGVNTAEVRLAHQVSGHRRSLRYHYCCMRQHCCSIESSLVPVLKRQSEGLSSGVVLLLATPLHLFLHLLMLARLFTAVVCRCRGRRGNGQAGKGWAGQEQEQEHPAQEPAVFLPPVPHILLT